MRARAGSGGVAGGLRLGRVSAFDDARGLGEIQEPAGGTWAFHCTAIADGTRHIDVGAEVAFVLVAGHLGRMEAREVTGLE